MVIILSGLIYAAALTFLGACIWRILLYARTPMHLRWELYPVPHEEPQRALHGGSYFETTDWWTRPSHSSRMGEMKVMLPEILFLKGLREFNRPMWLRSFPFHAGLYLLTLATASLLVSAALPWWAPLYYVYTVSGIAGSALAFFGALGLLHRRLTTPELKNYTTFGDLFNLLFFVVTLACLAAGYAFRGPEFPGVRALVIGAFTFDPALEVPALFGAGLILGLLLLAYIPFTHMSHFIAKYFTYHSVRWDDRATARTGQVERKLAQYLMYRPTWAARHIGAGDGRTWGDIATANPAQGEKK